MVHVTGYVENTLQPSQVLRLVERTRTDGCKYGRAMHDWHETARWSYRGNPQKHHSILGTQRNCSKTTSPFRVCPTTDSRGSGDQIIAHAVRRGGGMPSASKPRQGRQSRPSSHWGREGRPPIALKTIWSSSRVSEGPDSVAPTGASSRESLPTHGSRRGLLSRRRYRG